MSEPESTIEALEDPTPNTIMPDREPLETSFPNRPGGRWLPFTRIEREQVHQSNWGEWIKFFGLILVLGITVLTVRLSRPLIFERIVPAVLGLDESPDQVILPDAAPASIAPTDGGVQSRQDLRPQEENPGDAGIMAEPAIAPEAEPVENPDPPLIESNPMEPGSMQGSDIIHFVRPGETLISIGELYQISPVVLATTNQLPNPHNIQIGQQLVIPNRQR